ncbi:MAG TPA: TauD/TfdA family dioxygenase [Pseudonocardiaceae bacterium]|nr:TauD/TfdA family dioxygenase [Pseudonocardiaceae bacterium]
MQLLPTDLPNQFNVEAVSPFGAMIRPARAEPTITKVPVATARNLVRRHHLLIFRGFDTWSDPEELTRYATTWGHVVTWPFGTVLELVEHEHPTDHVFDTTGVSFHWDGMFVDRIPEFQIFQCIKALDEGQGGRTTFCDTTRVLDNADTATQKLWESLTLTYQVTKETHYGGTAVSPLVVQHPTRGFPTMRYLEPVAENIGYVNRPRVKFHDLPDERVADIEQTLRDALYEPRHCYAHDWQTGDVVVADNYTLLHGREPYTSKCGRHLRRVHVLGDPPLMNPALLSQF